MGIGKENLKKITFDFAIHEKARARINFSNFSVEKIVNFSKKDALVGIK